MLIVEIARPTDPQPKALLEQSHALMQSLFPADACHYLSLDALMQDHIRFFVAREGAQVCGTGALAVMDGYGEVKSMFTAPNARGKGVGAALLRQIEDCAVDEGLTSLKLETGTGLDAAHRLYERHGFRPCEPFGSYTASPHSLFYAKLLPARSGT